MTQKDSTLIRIGRDLKFKLEQLAESWKVLYHGGRMDVPPPDDRDGISLDRVIRELLKRDDEHRTRSKSHSGRRKAGQGSGDKSAEGNGTDTF